MVATPSLKDGRYNHQYLDSVINSIIENSNHKSTKHIVVCCTTMPGYCNKLKDKVKGNGYTLSYNPEFIAQGSIIKDMENPDIVLIGEDTKEAGDIVEEINLSIVAAVLTIVGYSMNDTVVIYDRVRENLKKFTNFWPLIIKWNTKPYRNLFILKNIFKMTR